ncbi:hypothetical protein Y1Q_0024565 [Alligator mississippiensis]|uniref:Uncharacterized protein n=1 Tax=Alligator mississippiensis TaxID=8496 RepID=A0A151NB08_ALLMI|nr:hypothetical protein Y1Q_0024565 [Alligator mississippiensis]
MSRNSVETKQPAKFRTALAPRGVETLCLSKDSSARNYTNKIKRKQRHGKRTKINRWLKDCCSEESFGVFDYSEMSVKLLI